MKPNLNISKHGAWLRNFAREQGRFPRILHIGNIANNAYLNSKLLNRAGFESDVICYNYYHIMGCPEWEDADFTDKIEDDFYPSWTGPDTKEFHRPHWFAQGPMGSCAAYLTSLREGDHFKADWQRTALRFQAESHCASRRKERREGHQPRADWSEQLFQCFSDWYWPQPRFPAPADSFDDRVAALCARFKRLFPSRADQLQPDDFVAYRQDYPFWVELCRHYDFIVGYSTDGLYPLLARHDAYFAYEHGTIRGIPFEPTPTGRLCALTYRMANGTFITNCDNIVAAQKLKLPRFRFLPHPVNEDLSASIDPVGLRKELCARLNCKFLLFHPARQHWEPKRDPSWEKGNDILIEGFARFVKEVCPSAGAVFVEWGKTVEASRALLKQRGVAERVLWVPPQPNPRMIGYVQASDVLADQFYLGSFGSTLPKALLHGCPALLYMNEDQHRWCFPEMPPVINARTPEQVFEGLSRLYNQPEYSRDLIAKGKTWYRRYHSNQIILDGILDAMRERLDPRLSSRGSDEPMRLSAAEVR